MKKSFREAPANFDMAKSEQSHRHRMQTLEMVYPYLGWFAGFVGLLACVGLATYLAMNGQEKVAAGMLGDPALGVIGWFIQARLAPSENGDAEQMPPQKQAAGKKGRRQGR